MVKERAEVEGARDMCVIEVHSSRKDWPERPAVMTGESTVRDVSFTLALSIAFARMGKGYKSTIVPTSELDPDSATEDV